jgi:hypothetical protein
MPSLSGYDKGTKGFHGRRYVDDINAHLDFQSRLWDTVKESKKRLPFRVFLHGNHEYRIERAIQHSSELDGTIGYKDLQINDFYDEEVEYNGTTPGLYNLEGVSFAHFAVTGVSGRAISGEHLAYTLLAKHHGSVVVGHNHTFDYCIRHDINGKPMMGLCAGVFQDYIAEWAGECNKMWWRGLVELNNFGDGKYDVNAVSMEALKNEYS